MTQTTDACDDQLTEWGARLDQAVAHVRELPAAHRVIADEYALALDALSRSALTTMVRRLREDERGKELLFALLDDPAVRLLLGMHGVIRLPDPEQGERAAVGVAGQGAAQLDSGTNRAFFPLESMFRGPQTAHSCACDGAGCDCGGQ